MAARPVSVNLADCDVNLDFLTKEEREALLSKKMDMIRQRNRAINQRHEMIQADKRKAEESGNAVKALDSTIILPEGGANKGRGRGRGQSAHRDAGKQARERPKSHGDFRDASLYEPVVDFSELNNHKGDFKSKGGRGGQSYHKQDLDHHDPSSTPKSRRKPQPKDEASRGSRPVLSVSFDYEPIVDMKDLEQRYGIAPTTNSTPTPKKDQSFHSGKPRASSFSNSNSNRPAKTPEENNNGKAYDGRLRDVSGPPPDPSFNPLSDRRRANEKREAQNQDQKNQQRHPRNYGGGADLTRVKETMKTMREKEKDRPSSQKPLEIVMTGRERRNHQEWKQERDRYDQERIQRQMNNGGNWRREWDNDKVILEYDDHPKAEPGKRPAGRIGSGRFDRGERDDRARGGLQQQTSQPQHSSQPPQGASPAAPPSPQPSPQHGDGKSTPRGRGRGRGRARGRGVVSTPGDKSPRPRTWSGGDDRLVECQKEILLVKFENIAGDNTVEVEYDNEAAQSSPRPRSKSGSASLSSSGKGSTGRSQNQTPKQRGGKSSSQPQNKPSTKFSKGKGGSHKSSQQDQQDQFVDADMNAGIPPIPHSKSEEFRVRTSSHSQSYGDSEEWEECTGSSGMHTEDDDETGATKRVVASHGQQDLHLECQLNPEAPEFLPTSPDFLPTSPEFLMSPDFLKTPPGHVKVLNWAATGSSSPTSPRPLSLSSQLSSEPPNFSSPPPMTSPAVTSPPVASPHDSSSMSSPGSSASTRAIRRREECDSVPEPDQPCPPPFLLEDQPVRNAVSAAADIENVKENNHDNDGKEEEDADEFEDSVDAIAEDGTEEKSEATKTFEQTNELSKEAVTETKDDSLDHESAGDHNSELTVEKNDLPLNSIPADGEQPSKNDKNTEKEACTSGSNSNEDHQDSSSLSQERQQEVNTDAVHGSENACSEQATPVENSDVSDTNAEVKTGVESVKIDSSTIDADESAATSAENGAGDVSPNEVKVEAETEKINASTSEAKESVATPVENSDVSPATTAEVKVGVESEKIDDAFTTKAEVSADTSDSHNSCPTAEDSAPS